MRKLATPLAFAFALLLCAVQARAFDVSFEKDTTLPIVHLNVAIKSGAVTDPQGQLGLTEFMSRMLMRGTRTRSKEQIDIAIDQIGAQVGVETRAESVILRASALADKLPQLQALMTEILTQPSFPEREIQKLKSETISEILDALSDDSSLAARHFNRVLFRGHPYGNPVDGTQADVSKFNRAKVVAHYERLIKEGAMLTVGTGDASEDTVKSWSKSLGSIRPGEGVARGLKTPSDPPARRLVIVDKPDRTQAQVMLGQIGIKMSDPDYFPLYVANHAFGGGSFSARLMTELRVKRGWTYGAYSAFRHGTEPRSWMIHLYPAEKDTAAAVALTLKMVEELREKGLTAEEFEFAKRSLINSAGFGFNTAKKRVENALVEKTIDLPDGFFKNYGPEMEKVTLDQANRALKKFLRPGQLSVTVVGTASKLKEPLTQAVGVTGDQVEVREWTQE
jgi:zinc protease